MKTCNRCNETKELTQFYQEKKYRKYYRPECIECTKKQAKTFWKNNKEHCKKRNLEYWEKFGDKKTKLALLGSARSRAKEFNLEFSITIKDIEIPKFCPLLGIELRKGKGKISPNTPSIDRIDSNKGYTKDNIWIISFRANTSKNNLKFDELKMLAKNLDNKINEYTDYCI